MVATRQAIPSAGGRGGHGQRARFVLYAGDPGLSDCGS